MTIEHEPQFSQDIAPNLFSDMTTPAFAVKEPAVEVQDHYALALAYEKSLRQTDIVYVEETTRQLRLQILLSEDENDQLHEQLAQGDSRIDNLNTLCSELQGSLDATQGNLETAHSNLRLRLREIETIKVEVSSLHEVTMDSTKLLTEKLALARELSALKPEIDHLRSQAASHQTVLSEKLSLQRQVSALREELDMEKRATERVMAKERKWQAEEARVARQLETLQAGIIKERKERQELERESQKTSTDRETKIITLESRLDASRTRLKTTREQLKDSQAELQAARSASRLVSSNTTRNPGRDARKRTASLMEDDTIIGTPGDLQAAKKSKRASALPGDKSTFSITPFLNRTASVGPGQLDQELGNSGAGQDADAAAAAGQDSPLAKQKRAPAVTGQQPPENFQAAKTLKLSSALTTVEKDTANGVKPKAAPARKPRSAPALEQVAEEATVVDSRSTNTIHAEAESTIGDTTENQADKKRRRKLLGVGLTKTLFDDDDGEVVKGGRVTNGKGRAFGTLGRVMLGGIKAAPRFGGSASGFGDFSPLKKDRKASSE